MFETGLRYCIEWPDNNSQECCRQIYMRCCRRVQDIGDFMEQGACILLYLAIGIFQGFSRSVVIGNITSSRLWEYYEKP